MSTRVVDRVENWNERSFTEGYQALADLADEEFSGVIRAGDTALFMTKGVPIGIHDGDLTDFEGAGGTAYESPSPALPVLALMQDENEGVRDEFYSEQTSLADVDGKLSDGGFTGYIELSDNVLSGDYYLVYHGGRSMSVGFVGESARLIDGDEAFETANDEVGIYQIRPAEITPLDLPDPPETPVDELADESTESDEDSSESDEDDQNTTEAAGADDDTAQKDDTQDDSEGETPTNESAGDHSENASEPSAVNSQPITREETHSSPPARPPAEQPSANAPESVPNPQNQGNPQRSTPTGQQTPSTPKQTGPSNRGQQQRAASTGQSGTHQMETHVIPSLSPAHTQAKRTKSSRIEKQQPNSQQPPEQQPVADAQQPNQQPQQEPVGQQPQQSGSTPPSTHSGTEQQPVDAAQGESEIADTERETALEELEATREALDEKVEQLEAERDELAGENEELTAELEAVRSERDELVAEVEQLQSELNRLETELGAATDAEQRISPQEALLGTDIFVRYQSKGDATLETAHAGEAPRQELNNNLRLEKHTQFESASASVGGQTYGEFLDSTVEYQFVEWLVRELLFEIRDTGHAKELTDLYDVLPRIDRAELGGTVSVRTVEDGEESTLEESFDVVLRDRMGGPLLVANLNDSREAATGGMMERLITSAERVGESADGFAGAFLVTRSFFEPGALEIAGEATQSGFLNRDKRKSFVNLSRKSGYHLCLVEARNQNFHMAVPEL